MLSSISGLFYGNYLLLMFIDDLRLNVLYTLNKIRHSLRFFTQITKVTDIYMTFIQYSQMFDTYLVVGRCAHSLPR